MTRYRGWDSKLVKKQTEKSFQADVTKLAALYGWKFYHTWNSFHSVAGFPDLVMVRNNRLIFAELKTDTARLTEQQEEWLLTLAGTEAEVHTWRPSMIDDIVRILK